MKSNAKNHAQQAAEYAPKSHQDQLKGDDISRGRDQSRFVKDGRESSLETIAADQSLKAVIAQVCKQFYTSGWLLGTSGSMSIRHEDRIYCTPSGVQKERLSPDDIFVLNELGDKILDGPSTNAELKCSNCLKLFVLIYQTRDAGCCLHSHSLNANLITSLCEKLYNDKLIKRNNLQNENGTMLKNHKIDHISPRQLEFRIKNQEMIKGIKRGSSGERLNNYDTLIVPIIERTDHESDLDRPIAEAMQNYPETNAILVKDHGIYVWGSTWMEAKAMAECYDYLFQVQLEAYKLGLDWMLSEYH